MFDLSELGAGAYSSQSMSHASRGIDEPETVYKKHVPVSHYQFSGLDKNPEQARSSFRALGCSFEQVGEHTIRTCQAYGRQ